jgi:hypothetical protein
MNAGEPPERVQVLLERTRQWLASYIEPNDSLAHLQEAKSEPLEGAARPPDTANCFPAGQQCGAMRIDSKVFATASLNVAAQIYRVAMGGRPHVSKEPLLQSERAGMDLA